MEIISDITGGTETSPIRVVNVTEKDLATFSQLIRPYQSRPSYETRTLKELKRVAHIFGHQSCHGCALSCLRNCSCREMNSLKYYNYQLFRPNFNEVIQECISRCICKGSCGNTTVGNNKMPKMELRYSELKQFGVFTLEKIEKGDYVFFLAGELVKRKYLMENNVSSDYVVNTGVILTRNIRFRLNIECTSDLTNPETICIDARKFGNIGTYANHACDPNLSPQPVLIEQDKMQMPVLAMFANCKIQPNTELTWKYNFQEPRKVSQNETNNPSPYWIISDENDVSSVNNNILMNRHNLVPCYCGSIFCNDFVPQNFY